MYQCRSKLILDQRVLDKKKLLIIKSLKIKYNMILKEQKRDKFPFCSVYLTILQIFSPEVTQIRDQVWINVDLYGPQYTSWGILIKPKK